MSLENPNPPVKEEEIDLGQLFNLIGDMFQRLFNFVQSIFTGLFGLLLGFLLFFKKHFIKFVLAFIIGGVGGFVLDYLSPDLYHSSMVVSAKFGSTQQLYKNINLYNDLVAENEREILIKQLDIDLIQAESLREFTIQPIRNESEILRSYDEFVKASDTLTIRSVDIETFKRNFTDYDYEFHEILVSAEDKYVFPRLTEAIIEEIKKNEFFVKQREVDSLNLSRQADMLLSQLGDVDKISNAYYNILQSKAKLPEPGSGTNISFDSKESKTNELEILDKKAKIDKELSETKSKQVTDAEILNVVSDFSAVGVKEKGFLKKKTIQFAIGGAVIMLLFLILMEINRFLELKTTDIVD